MNTNPAPAPRPTIQEAIVVLTFGRGLTRLQMLNLVSGIDYSTHHRIEDIVSVSLIPHYTGDVRAEVCYIVRCPRTEDCRPILEALMNEEAYKSGAVTSHRVIGATRL